MARQAAMRLVDKEGRRGPWHRCTVNPQRRVYTCERCGGIEVVGESAVGPSHSHDGTRVLLSLCPQGELKAAGAVPVLGHVRRGRRKVNKRTGQVVAFRYSLKALREELALGPRLFRSRT